jgi:hypothetical protein
MWGRDPFRLDGSEPSEEQHPRSDLLLPFWFAKSHGLIP